MVGSAFFWRSLRDDLAGCLERVDSAIENATKVKMPTIWLHWDTIDSVILPKLIDWTAKTYAESIGQSAAFKSGLKPNAQFESERYRRYGPGKEPTASLARAKSPKPKKTTKPK